MQTAEQIFEEVRGDFLGKTEEVCIVIGSEPFFKEVIGTAKALTVSCHVQEFFAPVLRHKAKRMAIAHNHPTGYLIPSKNDLISTKALIEAAEMLGVVFVDHLIIHEEQFLSMYALGHIPQREVY